MVYHRIGGYYQLSSTDWAEIDRLLVTIKQTISQIQSDKAKIALHSANVPYISSGHVQYQVWSTEDDEQDEEVRIKDPLTGKQTNYIVRRKLTFSEKIEEIMQQKGMKRPEVYRRAGMDRTLFSKLLSNRNYSPSKDTAISVAFGLKLNLDEAEDLLKRAGFALSHSSARDLVIECCFKEGICEVVKVNIILEKLGYLPLNKISYR